MKCICKNAQNILMGVSFKTCRKVKLPYTELSDIFTEKSNFSFSCMYNVAAQRQVYS